MKNKSGYITKGVYGLQGGGNPWDSPFVDVRACA